MSFNKIFLTTSIYPTKNFSYFAKDFFYSIVSQKNRNFSCLFFLDCVEEMKISKYINLLKKNNIKVFLIKQKQPLLSPSDIRLALIRYAKKLHCDLLVISDFDEISDPYRVQEIASQMNGYHFGYNSFYPTDFHLKELTKKDFYALVSAPKIVQNISHIIDYNFIGLGSLAINPQKIPLPSIRTTDIPAFDWFLATHMLLNNCNGIRIDKTFVKYRQHPDSYIGIGKKLSKQSLKTGLYVKKKHYSLFANTAPIFYQKLEDILELEAFLRKNEDRYIRIINKNFSPQSLCWWENIKTLKEIKQWI